MIISNIYGGLGNQFFQYALGRKLSIYHDSELKLDINKMKKYYLRDYLLFHYNINSGIANKNEIFLYKKIKSKIYNKIERKLFKFGINPYNNIYYEKYNFMFDPNIINFNNIYIEGYWQSYKYFEDIKDTLMKDLSLKEPLDNINAKILNRIKTSNSVSIHFRRGDYTYNTNILDNIKTKILNRIKSSNAKILNRIKTSNSVSIHFRRGDYTYNRKTKDIFNVCPLNYYNKATELINKEIVNPVYFIFSDDMEWVKKNFSFNYDKVYVDVNDINHPHIDLELMKNCKHNIIANSTLSWWAAWLNKNTQKIVITPEKWLNKSINFDDLIPESWRKIEI